MPSITATGQTKDNLLDHYVTVAREMGLFEKYGWGVDPDGIRRSMDKYPEEFLEYIRDTIDSRTFTATGLILQMELGPQHSRPESILDYLHYHEILGGDEYLMSSANVSLLHMYKDSITLHSPLREAPPEDQLKFIALLKFVGSFQRRGEDGDWDTEAPDGLLKYDGQHMGRTYAYYIADPDMVKVIAKYHERVDEIASIIDFHGITQPSEVLFILDGGIPALVNGVL